MGLRGGEVGLDKRTLIFKKNILIFPYFFRLKEWEKEINAISADSAKLKVENDFDLEGPPRHMTYINQYRVIFLSFKRWGV